MKDSILDRPPTKTLLFGLRLPIWLYRLRFGWLLGDRFLMLTHKGRKSRLPHETVLEVVQHDKQSDTYYLVSGWGKKSDWYRNIQKDPSVTIHVGRRRFHAVAQFIPFSQAVEIMDAYVRDHPVAFRELSSLFLGQQSLPDNDAARLLAAKMPMVAFHPSIHLDRSSRPSVKDRDSK